MEKKKKSLFENPLFSTKVKSARAKIFPEGALGYFIGPTLALLTNSVLSSYFNKYLTDVLNMTAWASWFVTWLPVVSVIFVVLGNVVVGRLMDRNRTKAGKARPLLLISIPIAILALLVLFIISPFATDVINKESQVAALVCVAIGYNLWFAVAYPFYYTSHAALVNLSTRSSKDRSLLATISNATALAAMGLVNMIGSFFLGFLFVENEVDGVKVLDAAASYDRWKIFIIILLVVNVLGVLVEYYFTRERITEESFGKEKVEIKKAASVKQQAKVCFKDKFWWIIIAFFFLYQLGGMVKNVSQLYFCTAMFPDSNGQFTTAQGGIWNGTLSIIGAIPTALGMVIAWPLSNKIGKGKAILFGAILSTIGGAIGFIAPDNFALVVTSFVIKALGSTPAMYLSLALLADILDHQEAKHKLRTDGFTMTIYGAIMAGMTGIATGIMNGVIGGVGYTGTNVSSPAIQTALTWIFIGGETLCYAVIAVIFIFMNVEKFSDQDHKTIIENQKAEALANGEEWIEPEERLRREEAEAEAAAEEQRKTELKAKCEKKGLNYEEEESKYQAAQAEKKRIAEEKAAAKKKAAEEKAAKRQAVKSVKPAETEEKAENDDKKD
ncbi:MAG: MFS transporter [Clostridia bacterium]|nr:MFS transporter [Clostridia bacterium]